MHKCVYVVPTYGFPARPQGSFRLPRAHICHTFPPQQANGSRVNVLYSTPACYLWELNKANLTWYLGGLGSSGGWDALWVVTLPTMPLPLQVGEAG